MVPVIATRYVHDPYSFDGPIEVSRLFPSAPSAAAAPLRALPRPPFHRTPPPAVAAATGACNGGYPQTQYHHYSQYADLMVAPAVAATAAPYQFPVMPQPSPSLPPITTPTPTPNWRPSAPPAAVVRSPPHCQHCPSHNQPHLTQTTSDFLLPSSSASCLVQQGGDGGEGITPPPTPAQLGFAPVAMVATPTPMMGLYANASNDDIPASGSGLCGLSVGERSNSSVVGTPSASPRTPFDLPLAAQVPTFQQPKGQAQEHSENAATTVAHFPPPRERTALELALDKYGPLHPFAQGAKCDHYPSWRRLRAKKGFNHLVCHSCGCKWKSPVTASFYFASPKRPMDPTLPACEEGDNSAEEEAEGSEELN